jgi:hypothetical protein
MTVENHNFYWDSNPGIFGIDYKIQRNQDLILST